MDAKKVYNDLRCNPDNLFITPSSNGNKFAVFVSETYTQGYDEGYTIHRQVTGWYSTIDNAQKFIDEYSDVYCEDHYGVIDA